MEAFIKHRGLVAGLDRINVDTDQIIPKQFLKRIERTGYGQFLFYDWRFAEDGSLQTDFELNASRFAGASILLTRANFGCGSSREHAPWSLMDYGFRAILAPSFADIFYNNSLKNGLLPVRLRADEVDELFCRLRERVGYELTVDLQSQTVSDDNGLRLTFEVEAFNRYCLLNGLDDIGLTLQHAEKIGEYEAQRMSFGESARG